MTDLRLRPIKLITWSSLLEIKRRKDLYVLAILIGLFLAVVLVARVVGFGETEEERIEAARLLLNLGLSVAFFLSAVITASSAARQLSKEWEDRTIYPLLAKPVSRLEVVVGKWSATVIAGSLVMTVLSLISLVAVPKAPGVEYALSAELLFTQTLSLAILSGLVLTLSIWFPRPVCILVGMAFHLGSGTALGLVKNRLPNEGNRIVAWMVDYFPDLSLFNLCGRFTNGETPLSLETIAALALYGLIYAGTLLAAAGWAFRRKSL